MEGELEYLENKIPAPQNIEIEEALLEQQVLDAELEQLQKKAKLKLHNGMVCVCVCVCGIDSSSAYTDNTHAFRIRDAGNRK